MKTKNFLMAVSAMFVMSAVSNPVMAAEAESTRVETVCEASDSDYGVDNTLYAILEGFGQNDYKAIFGADYKSNSIRIQNITQTSLETYEITGKHSYFGKFYMPHMDREFKAVITLEGNRNVKVKFWKWCDKDRNQDAHWEEGYPISMRY